MVSSRLINDLLVDILCLAWTMVLYTIGWDLAERTLGVEELGRWFCETKTVPNPGTRG